MTTSNEARRFAYDRGTSTIRTDLHLPFGEQTIVAHVGAQMRFTDPFHPQSHIDGEALVAAYNAANEARPAETGDWVLVPRLPTEAMNNAGYREWNRLRAGSVDLIYRAMLAATPTPEPVDLGAMAEEIAAYRSDGLWHLEIAEGKGYDSVTAALEAAPPVRKPVDLGADAERGAGICPVCMGCGFSNPQASTEPCASCGGSGADTASVDATIERCAQVLDDLAAEEDEALASGALDTPAERGRTAVIAREFRRAAKKVRALSSTTQDGEGA